MLFTTHNYQDGKKKNYSKKGDACMVTKKKATIVHVKTDPEGLM